MKTKLYEYFGDKIIIADITGKLNIVTFRTTAAAILQKFHAQQDDMNIKKQKWNIVKTAAQLIKNYLKSIATSSDNYPTIATDVESHVHHTIYPPPFQRSCLREKQHIEGSIHRASHCSGCAATSSYCTFTDRACNSVAPQLHLVLSYWHLASPRIFFIIPRSANVQLE